MTVMTPLRRPVDEPVGPPVPIIDGPVAEPGDAPVATRLTTTSVLGYLQVRMTAPGSPGAADRHRLVDAARRQGWALEHVFVDAAGLGPRVGMDSLVTAVRERRRSGTPVHAIVVPTPEHLDRDPMAREEVRLRLEDVTGVPVIVVSTLPGEQSAPAGPDYF